MTKIPKMNHDEEQHTLSNARRAVMMPSSPDVCHPILRNTSVTNPPKLQTKTADKHHNQWVTPAVPQKQYFTSLAQKLTSKPSGKSCLMLFSPFQIHRRKKIKKNSPLWERSTWVHLKKKKSFASIQKRSQLNRNFLSDCREKRSMKTMRRELETQKDWIVIEKSVVQRKVDPFLYNCPVLVDFAWFLINCNKNLSSSLFSCAKVDFGCSWFVVQNWKNPLWNGNVLLRFEEFNNKIILSLPTGLIQRSALIIECHSSILCLFLSPLVLLRPLVGLLRRILYSLTLSHYHYCISIWPCPKHNTRLRSLSMLVLSNSDTHNLNGYIGWCGCHEIFIALW